MSRLRLFTMALVVSGVFAAPAAAQPLSRSSAGPVIVDYGPVYGVVSPDFATPDMPSRVVFEIALGAAEPNQLNARIETAARYLNMHAQAGVAPENLSVALVLHGTAGKDLLNQAAFRDRHGVDNPNYDMIQQLMGAGVEIILCGQTQVHRGLRRETLAPGVQVALSAMTALVALQSRGYQLIAF